MLFLRAKSCARIDVSIICEPTLMTRPPNERFIGRMFRVLILLADARFQRRHKFGFLRLGQGAWQR